MTHSMTAYAMVQKQLGECTLSWELKSVNHRYFEVYFRLPDTLRYLDMQLRNSLRGMIHRGKLECQLKLNEGSSPHLSTVVNTELVEALIAAGSTIASKQQIGNDLTVGQLLAWPGVVQVSSAEPMEGLDQHIVQSFQEALEQLQTARASEGSLLRDHILQRLQLLTEEVIHARSHVSLTAGYLKDKLLTRLQQIEMQVDPARIEQEIALILVRCDVSEELDRLDTHINEVHRLLHSHEVSGRRLDFLMQELNREANTLGSKSDSVELTQHAVQMKVLIEQMREQIQNIE